MHALRVERAAGAVTLTLDPPERRNAIDVPTPRALAEALRAAADTREDRVVVLTGAGGNFCAGGDLQGAASSGEASPEGARRAMRESVGAACLALHALPKPCIAAVEEARRAPTRTSPSAATSCWPASRRFGEVFVHRGLSVDSGGSWLPRLVGLTAPKAVFLGD
jgi:2-(1,2-epoxy-1,2-dihydrophenyl)acetyl-CoA isomerase